MHQAIVLECYGYVCTPCSISGCIWQCIIALVILVANQAICMYNYYEFNYLKHQYDTLLYNNWKYYQGPQWKLATV